MTREEASNLEQAFGVLFPPVYREAVTDAYPFRGPTEELDIDAASLRESNEYFRATDPWGFPWQPHYWCIGGDGAGGFYFIDTHQDDAVVYYCDHERMPASIDDLDRISVTPFLEFLDEVREVEIEMEKWEEEMKLQVANRKWWQFWIPRQWPPKRKT